MLNFEPEKLHLKIMDEEPCYNLTPRKYTLTHSDETGELFLTVGKNYEYSKAADQVLAEWVAEDGKYSLNLYIEVDGGAGLTQTVGRDKMFREALPLVLKAIVYGDKEFLDSHKEVMNAPIIVNFRSSIPEYNKVEDWGAVKDYYNNNDEDVNLSGRWRSFRQEDDQIEASMIYPPYPWPSPGPGLGPVPPRPPRPPRPPQGRDIIIEKSLINTLSPYIKSEIYVAFGRSAYYCLQEAEIIRARTIRSYGPCSEEYEVIVGLRVGRRPPRDNNIRITFVINENSIRVRDVDRPRPRE